MNREIKFRTWDKESKEMIYSVQNSFGSILHNNERFDVMQSTGMFDNSKSKKEIYESDIIKWLGFEVENGKQIRPERTFVVEFTTNCLYKILRLLDANGTLEVIGNIYETGIATYDNK